MPTEKNLDQLNDTGALAGTETIHVRDGGVDERSTVGAVVTLAQTGMASDAELAAHEADTTSVHGIADTSALLDTSDIGTTVQAYDVDIATVAASQAEMEAGTETALRSMSPARVAQAIAALAAGGGGDPLDANNIIATRIFGR